MNTTRRTFVISAIGSWAALDGAGGARAAEAAEVRVYVFAVSNVRPHVLQKMMENEMPGVAVSVFGRVGDFSRALEESLPHAAVALAPVLDTLGLKADVQGTHSGSRTEQYLVLSEADLRPEQLAQVRIGCVDFVGRKKLPDFVATVLGLERVADVQRVIKVEDLLQLVQFKRADAILLPERFLSEIREVTKLSLKVMRPSQANVLRTAIAFPGGRHSVETALRGLSRGIMEHLGVDAWS